MFDFIYSEAWWIKTIIAGLITGISSGGCTYLLLERRVSNINRLFNREYYKNTDASALERYNKLSKEYEDMGCRLSEMQGRIHSLESTIKLIGKTELLNQQ